MPLSRHFYELDEVVAALQRCLWTCPHKGRALFWLWELVVSQEETLATDTLNDAWLQHGGGLFVRQLQGLQQDKWADRCLIIYEAIQVAGSLSASRLLEKVALITDPPTLSGAVTPSSSLPFIRTLDPAETLSASEANAFWHGYDRACRSPNSRVIALWHLLHVQESLSADGIWSAINIAAKGDPIVKRLQESASPHPESQLLHQIAATLILCTPPLKRYQEEMSFVMGHYRNDWAAWNTTIGRRAARLHAIPTEAAIVRAKIPAGYSNIDDVRNPITLLSEGCRFWRQVMDTKDYTYDRTKDELIFGSDEAKEEFYARYFPDDTPDEWSLEDQRKSHGPGTQQGTQQGTGN